MPETKKYLNRDGLEEYNSLLPHSSTEIQEYVDDWLDEHPEATTTVQDGAISEPKLADKSVSLRTLADDTVHMLNGMILTREISGNVLSADDAYSAPPVSLAINGKSTQDGTPTPENPVPIQSIEVLNLFVTFAGKNLFDIAKVIRTSANVSVNGTTITTIGGNRDIFTGTNGASTIVSDLSKVLWLPAGTYTISCGKSSGKQMVLDAVDTNGTVSVITASAAAGTSWTATFTLESATHLTIRGTDQKITNLQIETGTVATAYAPHVIPITAQIPMQGHVLRSLPDGTKDTLALAYLRPSTREGWAVYGAELVQVADEVDLGSLVWSNYGSDDTQKFTAALANVAPSGWSRNLGYCTCYTIESTQSYTTPMLDNTIRRRPDSHTIMARDARFVESQDATAFTTAIAGQTLTYSLETPITHDLGEIELPVLPAPNCTVWADTTTGLQMEYVRDSNIVIQRIEEAIADL